MTLTMRAIVPGDEALRQIKAVRHAWFEALKAEGRAIKAEYEKTTRTWQHDVYFKISTKVSPKTSYTEVWTGNDKYWFVHEGIKVMHAILSSNWSPKTTPGVLSSGAGSGFVVAINKNYYGKRYTPRKFTDAIIKERQPKFQAAMEKATQDAVK